MKEKHLRIEGSPASMLVQLMRKHGYNKDITIEVGVVVTPLPDLSVRLPYDGLTLDRDDLIVSGTVISQNPNAGDKVIVIGDDDTDNYFVMDTAN